MNNLERKIKQLAEDIFESKTQEKRIRKFDKYLKEWSIIRLTPTKRKEINNIFQKNNLEVIKPYSENKNLNLLKIDKTDNIIIKYNKMTNKLTEITKIKKGNVNIPIFPVTNGNCPKRPYQFQEEAYKSLNRFYNNSNNKKGLLILPTGSGKTFTSVSWLLRNVVNENKKIIWVAHRHELLEQVKNEIGKLCYSNILPNMKNEKISVHLISGSHDRAVRINKDDNIIIASVQTLNRNLDHLYEKYLQYNDDIFLVIDEAHHATARTYRSLIDRIENSCSKFNVLGLTATPYRTAEKEKSYLSKIFDSTPIYKKDLNDLITKKILAKPIFIPVETNQTFTKEDFNKKELELLQSNFDLPEKVKKKIIERKDRDRLIVEHYIEQKEKYKKTIVFALDQTHALQLDALFNNNGIKSKYVISGTQTANHINSSKEDNKIAIGEFRENKLETLVNVNILTEGTDLPKTQTIFLTRPTKSKTLMTQMVGRALRGPKANGTKEAYIVSFIDNWSDLVAWKSPSELFVDENDLSDKSKDYRKYKVQFISVELMQQFANIADKTVDSELLESYPAIMRIPIGWYSFELEQKLDNEGIDYKSCKVIVFEQHKQAFDDLAENIKDLIKRYDYNNNNRLDKDEIPDLLKEVKRKYFNDIEYSEPKIQEEDIIDILKYYDENGTTPNYFEFEERDKYDISLLANQIINKEMTRSQEANFITKQWNGKEGKSMWKEFYNNNMKFFRNDIYLEIDKHYNSEDYKIEEAPKVEYKQEKLENFNLYEWPQKEFRIMYEAVYEKWNKENPHKSIAKKDRWRYEIDHTDPRNNDGKTILDNLKPMLRHENRIKGDKIIGK